MTNKLLFKTYSTAYYKLTVFLFIYLNFQNVCVLTITEVKGQRQRGREKAPAVERGHPFLHFSILLGFRAYTQVCPSVGAKTHSTVSPQPVVHRAGPIQHKHSLYSRCSSENK